MADIAHPTLGNGKICYLEIPAADIDVSSKFYAKVFGWKVRRRGDGAIAFDDGVGEVSGTWSKGVKAETDPAIITYIMVDDMSATLATIESEGGRIVERVGRHAPEITARFGDPAGNVFGLYQHPSYKT